jgi:hypothetical protein
MHICYIQQGIVVTKGVGFSLILVIKLKLKWYFAVLTIWMIIIFQKKLLL